MFDELAARDWSLDVAWAFPNMIITALRTSLGECIAVGTTH